MPNVFETLTDKKYLDANGLTYFCRILNRYPDNEVLSAVIDAIQDMFDEYGNAKIFSGVCSTGASTAAKTVTCSRFTQSELVAGAIVFVRFTETNTYSTLSNLTLNVNSTGAKPIRVVENGSVNDIPSVGYLLSNQTYRFTYDGTNWIVECQNVLNQSLSVASISDDNNGNVTIET